jgi:hypothetical protein
VRQDVTVDSYLANLETRPEVSVSEIAAGEKPPGYPQKMMGMEMSKDFMAEIWDRREVQGMRATWPMSVHGLMTTFRVLPEDLYHRVMETDESIPKGAVFEEIVNRFGTPSEYASAPKMRM